MPAPSRTELEDRIRALEAEIEQHRRDTEVLRRSELRYRRLVEHLTHEVHIWELVRDDAGAILTWRLDYANPAALKSWGRELDDTVGLTTEQIFPGANATAQFLPTIEAMHRDNRPRLWEEYFEGTGQTLQMVSIPVGEFFISTGLDVTELKQMEEELRQAHKMEAVGQLAGGIAHDFNNQLAGILGYAELLEASLTDEPLLSAIRNIQSSARRSADLTSQLLAFARKGRADHAPVDAHALLRETVDLLRHSVDRSIEIRCDLPTEDGWVLGDSSLLQNAVLNIALNARDAMPDGGVLSFEARTLSLDAAACAETGGALAVGDYLRIGIRDTGSGMSEEVAARVFDPFFTTKPEGNGMGLAGAYGTVQRCGGAIRLESEPGVGTCFWIDLPLCERGPGSDVDVSPQPPARAEDAPLRILVADDERLLCNLCSDILSRSGHQVSTVYDGQQALEHYERSWQQTDLVILDVNMPKLNGLQTFRAMKEINPDVKVLIASGYSVEETAAEMRAEGVRGFVQKPFDLKTLLQAVGEFG